MQLVTLPRRRLTWIAAAMLSSACGGGADENLAPGTTSGVNGIAVQGVDDVGGFNQPGNGSGNGSGSGSGNGNSCIELDIQAERLTPTVLLLLDRSGSMEEDFGGQDRWQTLRDILVNPETGVLGRFAAEIQFGIATYTSFDGNAGGTCPALETLPIGMANLASAEAFLPGSDTLVGDSDTPTAESVTAAAQMLATQATMVGPKAIILATDGEPDTCADPDAHNQASKDLSEAAVQAAYDMGIQTYVISVGDEVSDEHLQDLANAGVGVESGAEFYKALNADALADAFNSIIYGALPCEFELNGTVVDGGAGQGSVVVGGTAAVLGDPNGWDLPTSNTVVLNGTACEAAKTGALIEIDFPCELFVIR